MEDKTTIQKLKDAHERLLKIHVRGEESVLLAEAIIALTQTINEMEDEK